MNKKLRLFKILFKRNNRLRFFKIVFKRDKKLAQFFKFSLNILINTIVFLVVTMEYNKT